MVILFDVYNLPEDLYAIIFNTPQQRIVAKVLVKKMKEYGGEMTKTMMSEFATKLDHGEIITQIDEKPYVGKTIKLSYNKMQFYERILTPMRGMGFIEYDLYRKVYKFSTRFNQTLTIISRYWLREVKDFAKEASYV